MDSCGPFLLPPERPSVPAKAKTEKSADKPTKDPPASTPPTRKAWILVIVDYFTKVAEFAIIQYEHSASAVASAAYEHKISRYPRPIKWTGHGLRHGEPRRLRRPMQIPRHCSHHSRRVQPDG